VDFNDILSKVDRLLSRIIGEDIELTINPCKNKLTILGDEGQIEQILMNLASNARDAMQGNGRLKIEVDETILDTSFQELHGYGEKGHYALLTVSDNGSGMDEATKERVFEPFFTTKELGKGTGLGLAMVYSIVKQHKGFINVYSEPGKGTTFRIYLPLTGFAPKDNGDGVQLPQRGFGETILIVEDSEEIRNVFGDMLKDFGYRVISADNGEEGVEKFMLHRDEIDLLLLDVIMPRKNGMQTLNDIRFLKPDVKALFMSGYTADVINDKGIDTERIDMLSKPFSPLSLFAKVREVLDRPMEESI
jgi:CheY-like chemotaxis protein